MSKLCTVCHLGFEWK